VRTALGDGGAYDQVRRALVGLPGLELRAHPGDGALSLRVPGDPQAWLAPVAHALASAGVRLTSVALRRDIEGLLFDYCERPN
jgi:hypothetical protein